LFFIYFYSFCLLTLWLFGLYSFIESLLLVNIGSDRFGSVRFGTVRTGPVRFRTDRTETDRSGSERSGAGRPGVFEWWERSGPDRSGGPVLDGATFGAVWRTVAVANRGLRRREAPAVPDGLVFTRLPGLPGVLSFRSPDPVRGPQGYLPKSSH
jgi:hypothetical protein